MSSPVPGQPFGRYLVDAFIARGGMGEIYRATDATLRRPVALKVLSRHEAAADDGVTRFLREARLAAELAHPHIVVVYEAGQVDDTLYLAMEWIEGLTLRAALDRARMTLQQRLQIASAIGDALAYAHARGVVHRDVKPSNVILDAHGRPKLLDFGIAKRALMRADATFQTGDGAILGTPLYMAPEQMHTANVTAAADQFAWAVVAYETIAGKHPRDTAGPHFPFGLARGLPWPGGVGRDLASVVERAMCPDPAGRFGSMQELLAAWSSALAPGSRAPRREVDGATIAPSLRGDTRPDTKQELGAVQMHPRAPVHREDAASRLLPLFIGILVVLVTSVVSIGLAVRIRRAHPDRGEAVEAPLPKTEPPILSTASPPRPAEDSPPALATPANARRPPTPRATAKADSKSDPPAEVKAASEPSGAPKSARPATFVIASSHRRALDEVEIAAAAAAARDMDACVAQHGGLVAGDQIYVNVYFGQQTRILEDIVHDAQKPLPGALRPCVDAALARIPFRPHDSKMPVSFAYDF